VPSGNFGNICAGHIAQMMGLPIRKLVLATNENDVLDEFFKKGVYRPRGTEQTYHTSSPSMDISKASNFERFIFDLTGRDGALVRQLWAKIDQGGEFELDTPAHQALWQKLPEFGFVSGRSTHADRLHTIREIWQQYHLMVDPHTADGLKIGIQEQEAGVPMICLETALPAKFDETIREALDLEPERPASMNNIEQLPQRFEVMDKKAELIKEYIAQHC
jgi:threonine synthase